MVSQVRPAVRSQPLIHYADNYTASQHLGRTLRKPGADGIAYDRVHRMGVNASPAPGRHFYRTPDKSGISATSGIVGMAGKSRPSMKSGNSTMTGCPEVPIMKGPAGRSNVYVRLCTPHVVARLGRLARHLREAGGRLGISSGLCGSLIAGNRW